jgi:hypothetical protein
LSGYLPSFIIRIQQVADIHERKPQELAHFFDLLQAPDIVCGVASIVPLCATAGVEQSKLLVIAQSALGEACTGRDLLDRKELLLIFSQCSICG